MASLGTRVRAELMKILGKEAEVEKASTGTFVSRPVLNGSEWAAWAKSAGVPSPIAAADLHVTIVSSTATVQMIPDDCPVALDATRGVFAMLGPDEDAFALAVDSYQLQDRHWTYVNNGAQTDWPTYRPHMTLSSDAKDFELDGSMLASAPRYIILGAEVSVPLASNAADDDDDPEGDGDDDDDDGAIVIVVQIAQAAKALERDDLSALDRAALYDVVQERPVTVGVAKRLGVIEADIAKGAKKAAKGEYGSSSDAGYADPGYQDDGKPRYPLKQGGKWSEERIRAAWSYINKSANQTAYSATQVASIKAKIVSAWKAAIEPAGPPSAAEAKKSSRDVVVTMTQPMREVVKSKVATEVLKSAGEEQRLIYAISNVYSIGGETVLDTQGEGFTTQAMEEFIADVLKRDKSSTWEHEGDPANVVVQGFVLSHEVQKALGIDLGFECLVTATHFPEEAEWTKAKAGPWEQSIAGRFWCWDEGE